MCHVVILVTDKAGGGDDNNNSHDQTYDPSLVHFIKQVEKSLGDQQQLDSSSSSPSLSTHQDPSFFLPPPQLLIVANKQPASSFDPAVFKSRLHSLAASLAPDSNNSSNNRRRLLYTLDSRKFGLLRAYPKRYGGGIMTSPPVLDTSVPSPSPLLLPSVFALPFFNSTSSPSSIATTTTTAFPSSSSIPDRYPILLLKLVHQILELPRYFNHPSSPSTHTMSEREWFRILAKCADGLRQAHLRNSARVGRDESARQGRGRILPTMDKG